MKALAVVALMGLALAGCDDNKKSEASALPSSVVAPSQTAGAVPASTSAAVAGAIPAEEDFEGKAEASITPANASEELSKLDKEIGQ